MSEWKPGYTLFGYLEWADLDLDRLDSLILHRVVMAEYMTLSISLTWKTVTTITMATTFI